MANSTLSEFLQIVVTLIACMWVAAEAYRIKGLYSECERKVVHAENILERCRGNLGEEESPFIDCKEARRIKNNSDSMIGCALLEWWDSSFVSRMGKAVVENSWITGIVVCVVLFTVLYTLKSMVSAFFFHAVYGGRPIYQQPQMQYYGGGGPPPPYWPQTTTYLTLPPSSSSSTRAVTTMYPGWDRCAHTATTKSQNRNWLAYY